VEYCLTFPNFKAFQSLLMRHSWRAEACFIWCDYRAKSF